jgi:hypothetical protein
MLRRKRETELHIQLEMLEILLERDVLEEYQLEEAGRRILQRFAGSIEPE